MVIGLIGMVAQEAIHWGRWGQFVQMMICQKPFMLEFVDSKTLIQRKTKNGAFVGLPVDEVPDIQVPVVASCCVVPQGAVG